MTDPNHVKPGHRPGGGGPGTPDSSPSGSAPSDSKAASGGRVVHDSRGNAVWQWVKDTGRHALESTSAVLKKLEVPDLKVEDQNGDGELKLEEDVDAGGGYDPYGTRVGSKKPPPPKPPLKKR